jgi:crossover junction endodeoxyribonuclease RuvC
MFERVIIGVDPGTSAVGIAVVATANGSARSVVRAAMTFRTASADPTAHRLRLIADAVRAVIEEHRPEALAIERLMWNKNVVSAMEVARASGAIMAAASAAGLPVDEYGPLEVKMAVTGVGNASKEQVRRGLGLLIGHANVPSQPDAADAVAIAYCHLQASRMRRLTREAGSR